MGRRQKGEAVRKEELNLPMNIDSMTIGFVDKYGNNVLSAPTEKEIEFATKAVNTYHEREELIRDMIKSLDSVGDGSYMDCPGKRSDIIQKAKNILGE